MPVCKTCGITFEPIHHNQTKFCSKKCSIKVHSYSAPLEKRREWGRNSYHRRKEDPKNIIAFILRNAKARANKKQIEFSLTENDIVLPTHCPILGVPLEKSGRRYGYSLDRKDPTMGYTKENIWVISQLANAMKWDSTREERLAFANWVLTSEGGQ